MIPVRRTAFVLSRPWFSSQNATYTTRSNGAAFLNNLDFLAPAPSLRTPAPAPSQPRSFQQIKTNNLQRSPPNQSSNKEYLKGASSLVDSLDSLLDIPPSSNNSSGSKGPVKRAHAGSSTFNTSNTINRNNVANDKDRGVKRPVLDRPRRDEEIDSQWIQYVTPEGNQGEKSLRHVLRSFDRSQYFLIEVDSGANPPICKLFSKKELYEKAKAAKQAKKSNELSTKELQLNWGTDAHDLEHKLSKCRGFLEKGYRLEIQINGKKGKNTTPQERETVMERVKAEFEPVSKYVKQPEWVKATTVTMLLQGLTKKADKGKKQQQQQS